MYKPTYAHRLIQLLNEEGRLLRCFTQNIDGLEAIAGIPEDKLVFAHGTYSSAHCAHCHKEYSREFIEPFLKDAEVAWCECGYPIKPDIVFFGENLPERFFTQMKEDFPKCDLFIVMGTSLKVMPFSWIIEKPPRNVPRLMINMEKVAVNNEEFADLPSMKEVGTNYNY